MTNQEFIESIRLKGEEWREIPGWERYAASTDGRIASLGEPYLCGARVCCRKPQLLTPRKIKGTTNYLSVVLSNGEGNRRSFLVHCLVARTFIPNPQNLPFINHKDENPSNNKCENLEWCTQKYNCNYGTHKTRMAKPSAKTHTKGRRSSNFLWMVHLSLFMIALLSHPEHLG